MADDDASNTKRKQSFLFFLRHSSLAYRCDDWIRSITWTENSKSAEIVASTSRLSLDRNLQHYL